MSRADGAEVTATTFAALGDPTRLAMIERLADGTGKSMATMANGHTLTRQAIAKHLRMLERAELVYSRRAGRENLYALRPERVDAARTYLAEIADRWDAALARLKAHVEEA